MAPSSAFDCEWLLLIPQNFKELGEDLKLFALLGVEFNSFELRVLRTEFDPKVAPAVLRLSLLAELSLHGVAIS